jgi:hypothetical protein
MRFHPHSLRTYRQGFIALATTKTTVLQQILQDFAQCC